MKEKQSARRERRLRWKL